MTSTAVAGARVRNGPCTVLVTDAGRGAAVAAIRSLARAGHRVIAADEARVSPGRWSRHAEGSVRYPDPYRDPLAAAARIAQACRAEGVDVVVPVTDAVVSALESHRHLLPEGCLLAVADPERLELVRDKQATLDVARRAGVPVPETVRARGLAEALCAAERLGWPLVLKPERSVAAGGEGLEKFEVAYAADPSELEQRMARFEGRTAVLVQELVRGHGVGVEVLAHEGTILAAFQHRRLHEVPVTGGASALRASEPLDPDLLRHSEALIRAIGWSGLAMVEFKAGPTGPRLMEVNGRLWGSLPLAVKAGVDFPALAVDLLRNGPPDAPPVLGRYRPGVRSRNLELEVVWIGGVLRGRRRKHHPALPFPPRREAVRAALRLLVPSDGYDIMSLRDPAPGVAEVLRIASKLVGKARRSPGE